MRAGAKKVRKSTEFYEIKMRSAVFISVIVWAMEKNANECKRKIHVKTKAKKGNSNSRNNEEKSTFKLCAYIVQNSNIFLEHFKLLRHVYPSIHPYIHRSQFTVRFRFTFYFDYFISAVRMFCLFGYIWMSSRFHFNANSWSVCMCVDLISHVYVI